MSLTVLMLNKLEFSKCMNEYFVISLEGLANQQEASQEEGCI